MLNMVLTSRRKLLNNTRICHVLDIDLLFCCDGDGKTGKESSTGERGLAFGENKATT